MRGCFEGSRLREVPVVTLDAVLWNSREGQDVADIVGQDVADIHAANGDPSVLQV
jgi:hypothetical protein